jgi:hypothetical protein
LLPAALLASRSGSGGHLQNEPEEADYKRKINEAVLSGFSGKSSVERRVLALCRLLKTKGLAILPDNIKGPKCHRE